MIADRLLAQVQPAGDVGIGPAFRDEFEYLPLPVGQLREDVRCGGRSGEIGQNTRGAKLHVLIQRNTVSKGRDPGECTNV